MLDFKNLQAASERLKSQNTTRNDKATEYYQQALLLLERYREDPNPELLKAAIHTLSDCLSYSKQFCEPYLMLAYIYYGLDLPRLSLKYLKAAEAIAPESSFLLELKQAMSQGKKLDAVADTPEDDIDYEALNTQLDAVFSQLRADLAAYPAITGMSPTLDAEVLDWLQAESRRFEELCEVLHGKLTLLEHDEDCFDKRNELRQAEAHLNQLKRITRICLAFREVAETIAQTQEQLLRLTDELSPQAIEPVLDRCDSIADRLDHFESEGIPLTALMGLYKSLVENVREKQELLDAY